MALSLTFAAQPGDDISSTSHELQGLADRLGFTCEARFNGVRLVATPGGDPQNLIDEYSACGRNPKSVQLAFSTHLLRREPIKKAAVGDHHA